MPPVTGRISGGRREPRHIAQSGGRSGQAIRHVLFSEQLRSNRHNARKCPDIPNKLDLMGGGNPVNDAVAGMASCLRDLIESPQVVTKNRMSISCVSANAGNTNGHCR